MQSSGVQNTRYCVSCGRTIPWDANVCPYCGHDYRITMMGPAAPPAKMGEGVKILLYIVSFLIPLVGIIVGVIYYIKPEPEYKDLGRNCIIIAVIMWVVYALCAIAVLA